MLTAERGAPRASVIMAVRDGGPLLDLAIASVLGQTVSALELVVVDDGSTDDTADRLRSAAAQDARVRLLSTSGLGQAPALVLGCAAASAPVLVRLDADDLARPDRLERQLVVLDLQPEVVLVGSAAEYADAGGVVFHRECPDDDDAALRQVLLDRGPPFVHSSTAFRRSAYERVGGYRPIFAPAEDYDLWLRLAELGRLRCLPEPLVTYRVRPAQLTSTMTVRMARSALVAREVAAARFRSEPEPVLTAGLDDSVLLALGVDAGRVREEFLRLAMWWAATLRSAGDEAGAIRLWRQALGTAVRCRPRGAWAARVLRARGRSYLQTGAPWRARRDLAVARLSGTRA